MIYILIDGQNEKFGPLYYDILKLESRIRKTRFVSVSLRNSLFNFGELLGLILQTAPSKRPENSSHIYVEVTPVNYSAKFS